VTGFIDTFSRLGTRPPLRRPRPLVEGWPQPASRCAPFTSQGRSRSQRSPASRARRAATRGGSSRGQGARAPRSPRRAAGDRPVAARVRLRAGRRPGVRRREHPVDDHDVRNRRRLRQRRQRTLLQHAVVQPGGMQPRAGALHDGARGVHADDTPRAGAEPGEHLIRRFAEVEQRREPALASSAASSGASVVVGRGIADAVAPAPWPPRASSTRCVRSTSPASTGSSPASWSSSRRASWPPSVSTGPGNRSSCCSRIARAGPQSSSSLRWRDTRGWLCPRMAVSSDTRTRRAPRWPTAAVARAPPIARRRRAAGRRRRTWIVNIKMSLSLVQRPASVR